MDNEIYDNKDFLWIFESDIKTTQSVITNQLSSFSFSKQVNLVQKYTCCKLVWIWRLSFYFIFGHR